jgi:hypothetical protein
MDPHFNDCPAKMQDGRFLTDHRTSNTREQYIKNLNGNENTDIHRTFMMDNAEKIIDNQWNRLVEQNGCKISTCIHTLPTRPVAGASNKELQLYNLVQSGKLKSSDKGYPSCESYPDYRLTQTNGTKW